MTLDQAISQIITYGSQIDSAYSQLASQQISIQLPFKVCESHLLNVLDKYLNNQISSDDLLLWATVVDNQNAIDSSDIEDYLYALVNEEMMGDISFETITKMRTLLNKEK